MQLRRLLVIIRRRLVLLVLIVTAGLVASYLGTSRTNVYEAQATIYVGNPSATLSTSTETAQAVLAAILAPVIPTPGVVASAINSTRVGRDAGEVVKQTKAAVASGANLIRVSVRDRDPVVAMVLTNGVAKAFVSGIQSLAPVGNGAGLPSNTPTASLAQPAIVPTAPLDPGLQRNVELGGLVGLLVGVGLILLLDYLALSARTPRELESDLGLPVLGVLPFQPQITDPGVILLVGDVV